MKARLVEPQDWPHQVKFMPATTAAATSSGIGIGKRNQRILAAEFEQHRLDRIGAGLHDGAPGLARCR